MGAGGAIKGLVSLLVVGLAVLVGVFHQYPEYRRGGFATFCNFVNKNPSPDLKNAR